MPTNVSTPIWCCDICRTRFGANRAAAERCEAAGSPAVLPAGELLLGFRAETYGTPQGFYLQRLYPLPGRIGTTASEWNTDAGHTATYLVDVDPAGLTGPDGVLRLPHPRPREVESPWLWPHQPGTLNVVREHWIGGQATTDAGPATWVLDLLDLSHPDAAGEAEPDVQWTRPLTAPVAAMLDALGATCEAAAPDAYRRFRWMWGRPLGALAAEAARGPDGVVNLHRARWWLHTVPAGRLVDDVNDRWRRWRVGEQLHVPKPRLRCREQRSASKLTRELRALVAATGVPWPPRTSSDEYADLLVRTALGYEMDTTEMLFRAPCVIAVTGVKGGVGKSTVAAALARRLATRHRVVLVDCDLTGPSQQILFDLGPALADPQGRRLRPSPTDLPTLTAFSPGQLFGPASKVGWDATTITQWLTFVGACLDLDDADVVVLDLPPGTSPVHEILFNPYRVALTASVHVTTAHPLSLADTERGLARLDRRHEHHHLLVENLSRAVGRAASSERVEVRLAGDADQVPALAERYRVAFGGSLPWVSAVPDLANTAEIEALAAAVMRAAPQPTR